MFYNKFVRLCQRDGISPSKAASLIGFNRSSVSMWKAQGYTPRREILVKIANYFNVSVDYLLGEKSVCSFYDRFSDLCKKNDISPSKMMAEIGISTGNLVTWKNGRIPKHEILNKIARYFNVSIDYLLGKEDTPQNDDNLTDTERKLLQLFNLVPKEKQNMVIQIIQTIIDNQ